MLKNQAFYFISVGTLLERAERVYQASIKVINKDAVGNKGTDGNFFDFYHWAALLRSVSAFEIYRQIYFDQVTPKQVTQLPSFN